MAQFAKQLNETNYQAYIPQDRTGEILSEGLAKSARAGTMAMGAANDFLVELEQGNKEKEVGIFTQELNDLNKEYVGRKIKPPMMSDHELQLDKVTNAFHQGAMTPAEYDVRVRAITRQAVNRAPAFTNELLSQANKVFELSGMKDMLREDALAIQSDKEAIANYSKNVVDLAKRAGLGYDASQLNNTAYLESLNEQANKILQREASYKAVESAVKNQDNLTKADLNTLFVRGADGKTSADKMFTGSTMAANAMVQGLFSQVTDEASFAAAKQQAVDLVTEQENSFMMALAPHIDDPKVKALVDRMKESNKTRLDAISKFSSKEDALTFAKNSQELFKSGAYMEYYERGDINPYQEEALIRIAQTPNLRSIIKEGKFNELQKAVTGLLDKSIRSFSNPEITKQVLSNAVGEIDKSPALADIINSFPKTIRDNKDRLTPNEMYRAQQDYVAAIAKGDSEKVKLMSPAGKADAINLISNYAKITWDSMVKDVTAASAEGKNVKFDTLPDGRLIVTGDISGEQSAKYTKRINDALQAMSNVYDISMKEAAQNYFYPALNPQQGNGNPKLNNAEKEMSKNVQLTAEEKQADISNEVSDASISELKAAVSNATGEAKVTLQAELDRVLKLKEELKYRPSEKSTTKDLVTGVEKFLSGDMFTESADNFIADFINELRRRRAVKDTQADLNSYSQSSSGKVKYKDKK